MSSDGGQTLEFVRRLSGVGIALSAEKDSARLMELILESAKDLTSADGGTLYTRTPDDRLHFEIMITDSLGVRTGGTSGQTADLPAIALFDDDGAPNGHNVAAHAAVTGETVNIRDAYDVDRYDFSGTRDFDGRTGYRSTSFLTVPMRNHEDEVIGVLQLINALDANGEVEAFDARDQLLVESLASQAAIALTNKRLINEQRVLFESFIELIAAAIDDKSPYTGGHCRRVPELTMMLADAAAASSEGPLASFQMSEDDRYELRIAGWLHDCGKVTTPEYVVDKSTKLETIFDRIELVRTRFAIARRDAEIASLRRALAARQGEGQGAGHGEGPGEAHGEELRRAELDAELARLDEELAFLERCNIGGEHMSRADQERVREIGMRRLAGHWRGSRDAFGYRPDHGERRLLTEDEIYNLSIPKGTLNPEEREIVNQHIVASIKMLESLPYPKHLARVPEFAGGHHERMDGTGYPRGLVREEMSVQARAMGIADIFEALTAADRPYKPPMKLSESLEILGRMKVDNHIDADLFDVFVREKVYLRYAERFLRPEQIDEVDETAIPGHAPFEERVARRA